MAPNRGARNCRDHVKRWRPKFKRKRIDIRKRRETNTSEDNLKSIGNTESAQPASKMNSERQCRPHKLPAVANCLPIILLLLLLILNCSPRATSTTKPAATNDLHRPPSTSFGWFPVGGHQHHRWASLPATQRGNARLLTMINDDRQRISSRVGQQQGQVSGEVSPQGRVQVPSAQQQQLEAAATTTTERPRKRRQAILAKQEKVGASPVLVESRSAIVRRSSEQQQQQANSNVSSSSGHSSNTTTANHSADEQLKPRDQASQNSRLMELKQRYMTNRAINDRAYYILLIMYSLFITFGTISNSLICLTVILKPRILSPRNIFIVNLAGSDLLLCVFTMPFSFIEISMKAWQMGLIPCKLVAGLQATSIFVSTISITAIAVDRYKVIVYPTHQEAASTRGAAVILAFVWFVALGLSLPLFYFRTIEHFSVAHKHKLDLCVEAWPLTHGRGIYSVISMIFQYVLPITIVSVVYAKINDKLQKRLIRRQRLTQLECQQKRQLNLIRRTHTMLVSVSLVFGLSWLPLNLLNVISDFTPIFPQDDQLFRIVFAICHLIGCSSACSNPILYGFLNENFRKEFHQVYTHYAHLLEKQLRRLLNCLGFRRKAETVDQLEDEERFQDQVGLYSQSNEYSSGSSSSSTSSDATSEYDDSSTSSSSSSSDGSHSNRNEAAQQSSSGDKLNNNSSQPAITDNNCEQLVAKSANIKLSSESLKQHSFDVASTHPNISPSNHRRSSQADFSRRFSFQTVTSGRQSFGQTMRFCLCISDSSSIETLGCAAPTGNVAPSSGPMHYIHQKEAHEEARQKVTNVTPTKHSGDAGHLDKQLSIEQKQQLARSERLESIDRQLHIPPPATPISGSSRQQQQTKVNLNEANEPKQGQDDGHEEEDKKQRKRRERRKTRKEKRRSRADNNEQADGEQEEHEAAKLEMFHCECKCHRMRVEKKRDDKRKRREKMLQLKEGAGMRMAAEISRDDKTGLLRRASRSGSIVNELLSNVRRLTQSGSPTRRPNNMCLPNCSIEQNDRSHRHQVAGLSAERANEATKMTKINRIRRKNSLLKKVAEEEREQDEACKRIEQQKQVKTRFSCLKGLSDDFDDQNNNNNFNCTEASGVFVCGPSAIQSTSKTTTSTAPGLEQTKSNRVNSATINPISGRRVWLRFLGSSSSTSGCQNSLLGAPASSQYENREHSTNANDLIMTMHRRDGSKQAKLTMKQREERDLNGSTSELGAKSRPKFDNGNGVNPGAERRESQAKVVSGPTVRAAATTTMANVRQQMHSFDTARDQSTSEPNNNNNKSKGSKTSRDGKKRRSKRERHCDNCKHNYQAYKKRSSSNLPERQKSFSKRLKNSSLEADQSERQNNNNNNTANAQQTKSAATNPLANSNSLSCQEQPSAATAAAATSTGKPNANKRAAPSGPAVQVGTCYLSVDLNHLRSRANSDLSLSRERSTSVVILGCEDTSAANNDFVNADLSSATAAAGASSPTTDGQIKTIDSRAGGSPAQLVPSVSGILERDRGEPDERDKLQVNNCETSEVGPSAEGKEMNDHVILLRNSNDGDTGSRLSLRSSKTRHTTEARLANSSSASGNTTTNSSSTNSMNCLSSSFVHGNLLDDDCDQSSAGSLCTCTGSSSCHSMSSSRGADESMGSSVMDGHCFNIAKPAQSQQQQQQEQTGSVQVNQLAITSAAGEPTALDRLARAHEYKLNVKSGNELRNNRGLLDEQAGQDRSYFSLKLSSTQEIEMQKSSCSLFAVPSNKTVPPATTPADQEKISGKSQSNAANRLFTSSSSLISKTTNQQQQRTTLPELAHMGDNHNSASGASKNRMLNNQLHRDRNPLERQLSHSNTILILPNSTATAAAAPSAKNKLTSDINLYNDHQCRLHKRAVNRRHHRHNCSIRSDIKHHATATTTTSSCSSTFATATTTTSRSSLVSELTCSSADRSPPLSRGSANSLPSAGMAGDQPRFDRRRFGSNETQSRQTDDANQLLIKPDEDPRMAPTAVEAESAGSTNVKIKPQRQPDRQIRCNGLRND